MLSISHKRASVFIWSRTATPSYRLVTAFFTRQQQFTFTTNVSKADPLKSILNCGSDWKRAKSVLSDLKKNSPSGVSMKIYNALIKSLVQGRQYQQALSLIEDMYQDDKRPTLNMYSMVIGGCSKGKRYDLILQLLSKMESHQVKPGIVNLNSAITACGNARKIDQALKIFKEITRKYQLAPDSYSYVAIISACNKSGRYEEAVHIYNSMTANNSPSNIQQPNAFVYNAMMSIFYNLGRQENLLEIYYTMLKSDEIDDSQISYGTVMMGYIKQGDSDKALKLYDQIILNRKKLHNVLKGESIFSAAITACGINRQWKLAHDIYNSMESEYGIAPGLISSTALISTYEKTGQWQKALEILDKLIEKRIKLDVVCLSAAISACEKGGQWEKALELFNSMIEQNIKPNVVTFSAVISACEKGGQWQKALDLFHSMNKNNIKPNVVTFSAVISACEKGGQWEKAVDLFNSMIEQNIKPNVITFSAVISACGKNNQWGKALDLFHSMESTYGLCPDEACFWPLIESLENNGEVEKAIEIVSIAQQRYFFNIIHDESDDILKVENSIFSQQKRNKMSRENKIGSIGQREEQGDEVDAGSIKCVVDLHELPASVARVLMRKLLRDWQQAQAEKAEEDKDDINIPKLPSFNQHHQPQQQLPSSGIKKGKSRSKRHYVLVITGKGKHSKDGLAVLPQAMRDFFQKDPSCLQGVVLHEAAKNYGRFYIELLPPT